MQLKLEKEKLKMEYINNQELLNKIANYQAELANIYVKAWYKAEKEKALTQAKETYNQANRPNTANENPKIEGSFWKLKNSSDKIEYFFRNGSSKANELLCLENESFRKGKWSYISKDEVEIDLGKKRKYSISELTNDKLKLTNVANNNEILEFEKA
jgi:hypothetical protein